MGDQIDQSQGVRSRPQRPLDDVLSVVAVVRLRPIRVLVNDFEGFRQAGLLDQVDTSSWPATVPAVEQLLCEGLELPPGLTVLVGENGTGKSTVVEMLAEACGLNPQGGSAMARLFRTRDSEPGLGAQLIVERARPAPLVLFPARGHHAQPLHLPGKQPRPAPGAVP